VSVRERETERLCDVKLLSGDMEQNILIHTLKRGLDSLKLQCVAVLQGVAVCCSETRSRTFRFTPSKEAYMHSKGPTNFHMSGSCATGE